VPLLGKDSVSTCEVGLSGLAAKLASPLALAKMAEGLAVHFPRTVPPPQFGVMRGKASPPLLTACVSDTMIILDRSGSITQSQWVMIMRPPPGWAIRGRGQPGE